MPPQAKAIQPTTSPTPEMCASLVQRLAAVFAPATTTAVEPLRRTVNTGVARTLPPPADIQFISPVVPVAPQTTEDAPTASETLVASASAVVAPVPPVPVGQELVQVAPSHGSASRDGAGPDGELVVLKEL